MISYHSIYVSQLFYSHLLPLMTQMTNYSEKKTLLILMFF